jgi:hypothetical protein
MKENTVIACVECKTSNKPLQIYPLVANGKVIALIYCCNDCIQTLKHIKLVKQ